MTSKSMSLDPLNQTLQSADSIQRLNSGDIALFKGNKWQGEEDARVVNRSTDVDEMRVLLSLDIMH